MSKPGVNIENIIGSDGRRVCEGDEFGAGDIGDHPDGMHASRIGRNHHHQAAATLLATAIQEMMFVPGGNHPRGQRVVWRCAHGTGAERETFWTVGIHGVLMRIGHMQTTCMSIQPPSSDVKAAAA